MIKRLKTPTTQIGKIKMGAQHPIVIQSMTNTDTADAQATATQAIELAKAGSEIVRLTVNTHQAAEAIPKIRQILTKEGFGDLPLIGDFHYNGHILLTEHPKMAATLDKYRINPGNVGFGEKHQYNFKQIIDIAIANGKPVRIGVNIGSLDQDLLTEMMDQGKTLIDAMVESAWRSAQIAQECGMKPEQIILSVKMSEVQQMLQAYQQLAERMQDEKQYYNIHLGLTEAGTSLQGTVSSSAALAILLQQGIGDTIRISLTPGPETPRTTEVEVCRQLLQSLEFRHFKPKVTSCPGCGRTGSDFFQTLAQQVTDEIKIRLPKWQAQYPGVEKLKIAVMGCIVNGPGEAKYADIAISLPGKMEKEVAPVYIKGQFIKSLEGNNILEQFMEMVEDYLQNKYQVHLPKK